MTNANLNTSDVIYRTAVTLTCPEGQKFPNGTNVKAVTCGVREWVGDTVDNCIGKTDTVHNVYTLLHIIQVPFNFANVAIVHKVATLNRDKTLKSAEK